MIGALQRKTVTPGASPSVTPDAKSYKLTPEGIVAIGLDDEEIGKLTPEEIAERDERTTKAVDLIATKYIWEF